MRPFLLGLMLLASATARAQNLPMSAQADTGGFASYAEGMRYSISSIFTADSTSQARAAKMYGRWESFWQIRYCPDTLAQGVSMFAPISDILDQTLRTPTSSSCLGSPAFKGNWTSLGPDYNSYNCKSGNCQTSGRVMAVWVHPIDKNYILAGAASGGLWKTTDGGQHWYNITDAASGIMTGTIGISSIAVNPMDENIIYISSNSYGITEYGSKYGLGLMYSTDGGASWQADISFRTLTGTGGGIASEIPKIAYQKNTERLYATHNNRVYVKPHPSLPWQDITPADMTNKCAQYGYALSDFEFSPNPADKVIFATAGFSPRHHLFIYNETLNSWASKELNFLAGDTCYGMQDIAVSINDEVYINFWKNNDNLPHQLFKTGLGPSSPLVQVNPGIHRVARKLAVSEANPSILYLTNCEGYADFIQKSTDAGSTWTTIGVTHADGRDIYVDKSTNTVDGIDDVLYCATDGGVALKPAGDDSFHSIVGNGLVIAQFSAMSGSPSRDYIVAGAIDNGNQNYIKDRTQPWRYHIDGDGLVPGFARNGVGKAFTQTQYGLSSGFVFSGNTAANDISVGNPPVNNAAPAKWWKPVKFDDQNTARIGWHYIWKKPLNSSDPWVYSFGSSTQHSEPKGINIDQTELLKLHKQPRDFIISERNPSVGYIAYADAGGDENQAVNQTGKLFYSAELHNTFPIWDNVTPLYASQLPITDIEIDPKNPERVWVAYGAVKMSELSVAPANRKYRVVYHADHGDKTISNWIDVSKGLPAVPITKIIYVEGSDDVLFAGTDVGVYRWNKAAQQWECFNEGMPRCMISDMEINYCTGKLRVSTFGRGIWETDYAADMASVVPGEVHTIAANTNWSSSKTVSGSIRVKSGATLTISGSATKIYMPRNGRILVEPGGALIVDGATLTNECGHLWKGIELGGQSGQPPVAALQGYCELRNQATIAYAKEGVWNFSPAYGYLGGGIIKAGNTTFYNCWRAVGLNEYPSYSYQYNGASQCSFDQCDFIIDDKALLPPGQMFSSWNTQSGARIRDCQFRNEMPQDPQQLGNARGTAIQLGHTGIQVDNTHFQGWSRGIYALGISRTPARTVKVYGNTFVDTRENVTMGAASYGDVKSNIFQYLPYGRGAYGVYLDNAVGSYVGCSNEIYGNYFGGALPRLGEIGVIANLTRNYATHVRNNYFYNLTIGAQTQLWNNNLHLQCNTHTGNAYPWLINPASEPYSFTDQGSSNDPAGNKFVSNMTGIRSYLNPNGWTYYAGSGANEIPSLQGNITLVSTGKTARCARPLDCYRSWGVTERNTALAEYSTLTANGQRYQEEGRLAYAAVIQAYNALGDMDGLETFLENESDNESDRLLVSLYTDQRKYTDAVNTLTALHLPAAEEDYYSLLIGLAQSGRRYDSLTAAEYQMVTNLAADEENEASAYAKAYLEANYSIAWEHPIEEMPIDEISRKVQLPQSPDGQQSKLMAPAPNPVESTATIGAFISEMDYKNKSFLIVRDAAGAEVYRSAPLAKGDNRLSIDVRQWKPGVYLVGLLAGDDVLETRKLSVVR